MPSIFAEFPYRTPAERVPYRTPTESLGFQALLEELSNEHGRLESENVSLRDQLERLKGHSCNVALSNKCVENDEPEKEGMSVETSFHRSLEASLQGPPMKLATIDVASASSSVAGVQTSVAESSEKRREGLDPSGLTGTQKWRVKASSNLLLLPSSTKNFSAKSTVSLNTMTETQLVLHSIWTSPTKADGPPVGLSRSLSTNLGMQKNIVRGGDTLMDPEHFMQRLIISPNSSKRMVWDFMSLLILTSDIIMVPMLAFDLPESPGMHAINMSCTLFWSCDVLLSCISGYHDRGAVEMRPGKIFHHYLHSWFLFDIIVISLDWIMMLVGATFKELVGMLRVTRLLRFTHVLRVLRVLKMPSLFDDIGDFIRTDTLMTALNVLKSLMVIACVNHFVACGWYAIGQIGGNQSWVHKTMDEEGRDTAFRYVTSLHWSLTQFTPASMEIYPRSFPERVYSICILFLALVVFSSFVSSITNAMNQLRVLHEDTSKQRDNLRRFIHENRLSIELGNRINAFARHHHLRSRTRVHEREIDVFKVLPETLRRQLHWEVYVPILTAHPFLSNCSEVFEAFILEVCHGGLAEMSLTHGQELFTSGEESKTFFFVIVGSLEYYLGDSDIESGVIHPTQWICEVNLWLHWRHQGRLTAVKRCEFAAIDSSTLRKSASHFPQLFEVCKVYAASYLEKVEHMASGMLDVWADHDVLMEMSQRAFDKCDVYPEWRKQDSFGDHSHATHRRFVMMMLE